MEPKFKPRKKLEHRCPHCNSSQCYYSKLREKWVCRKCKRTFKKPAGDN